MKAPRSRSNVIQARQIHSISQEFFLVYPMKLLWINHFEYTVHPAFVSGQLVSMKLYLLRLSCPRFLSVCCTSKHPDPEHPSIKAATCPRAQALQARKRPCATSWTHEELAQDTAAISAIYMFLWMPARQPTTFCKKMASNGSHVVFVCHSASVGERKSMTPHS